MNCSKCDELLAKIEHFRNVPFDPLIQALRAVVELHTPKGELDWAECDLCDVSYPCPTIQAIEEQLK